MDETKLLVVAVVLEHFWLHIFDKTVKLYTNHQSVPSMLLENDKNKFYSARIIRWLDKTLHFDVKVKQVSGDEIKLTKYLSQHPSMNAGSIRLFDGERLINPLILFCDWTTRLTWTKFIKETKRKHANI